MARRGGLKTNPLALLDDDDERQEKETVAAAQAAGAVVQELPIDAVAPDPENPASRLTPDNEFVNSIKTEGQLQAGVVVPLDAWSEHGNDIESLKKLLKDQERSLDDIGYVIVFGHRRWAGCRDAGLPTYKAVVTDDVKDRVTQVVHRLIENIQREDVRPIDEARDYQRLIKAKLSQREIARRTGRNQSHISKRLALLTLPEQAQAALDNGVITVEVAVEMTKLGKNTDRITRAIDKITGYAADDDADRARYARSVVTQELAGYQVEQEREAKRAELRKAGVTVIDDLKAHFAGRPHPREKYRLYSAEEVAAARTAGTAAAYIYGGLHNIEWYRTDEPPEQTTPADIPTPRDATTADTGTTTKATAEETDQQRRIREDRERIVADREREEREGAAAMHARDTACARIASKAPNRDNLTARLAQRVLSGAEEEWTYDAQQMTVKWLQAAGMLDTDATAYTVFNGHTTDPKTTARIAYVYDLALSEARICESTEWDAEDAEHVNRLIAEAAYQPAEWETKRLNELAAAVQ